MAIRVGLMGFGRIGKNIFRQVFEREDIVIAAISDLGDPEAMAYLLEYDTIYGRFPGQVRLDGKYLSAGRQRSRLLKGTHPDQMPWDAFDIDVVVEATHAYRRRADLQGHLDSGARRVILSTPAKDGIDRTIVHGVNHESLTAADRIVSCASATTHALGLMLKILDEAVGVEQAMMTTVHAYTSDQKLSDAVAKNLRRSRSAAENLIPNWSWSPHVVEELLPKLKGRIDGMAVNVPVPNGSNLDLAVQLKRSVKAEEINDIVRRAADGPYRPWLEFSAEPLVSSDVIGNLHSAVFDSLATLALDGGLVKTITWYDNGWGYAARIVETLVAMARFEGGGGAS
ncbi:MAG TPA: glyceraldehyde 3-phosphate dehydrogenase NAD-binding domain-containing protein [Candidatus Polarisedimenticolia bacterium]|nr:glyceraldehyde 3-phosphate dehydrogenase NAD-binding domain-containing protein [Candidatus Polarisedimenticolia bacterium]